MVALPKTNTAPKNGWLEDEISYWEGVFSGDIYVSLGQGMFFLIYIFCCVDSCFDDTTFLNVPDVGWSFIFSKIYKLHCTPTFFLKSLKSIDKVTG